MIDAAAEWARRCLSCAYFRGERAPDLVGSCTARLIDGCSDVRGDESCRLWTPEETSA